MALNSVSRAAPRVWGWSWKVQISNHRYLISINSGQRKGAHVSNKRHPVTQEIPTTLGALARTRKDRGLRRKALLRIPHHPSPGFSEAMLSRFSPSYSRRRPLSLPPAPRGHLYLNTSGHTDPEVHGHPHSSAPRLPSCPSLLLPSPPRLHNGQRLGVSLDGRCSHTQSLVKLLSPPLGNPGPLPSVCCTQLPPKEHAVERYLQSGAT